jgi:hypothetical protein
LASAWQYFASADWANAVNGKPSAKQAINNLVAGVMSGLLACPKRVAHNVARVEHRQGRTPAPPAEGDGSMASIRALRH